ncbi:hypothetical protein AB4089_14835 [Arthrobacter sp. 2MCAF15]|uniref:hypothetical protein n=1 Tax=Arthrobacter sp. 2MCAF15 TaxID=3232984 RepID=UPI003F92E9B0
MGVNNDHVGSRGRWFEQDPRVEPLPGKALPHFSGAGKVVGLYEHCCHVSLLPWIGPVIELAMEPVMKLAIELFIKPSMSSS